MADSKISENISVSNLENTFSIKDFDYQTIDLSSIEPISISLSDTDTGFMAQEVGAMASPSYTMSPMTTSIPTISISGTGIGISPAYSNTMWTTNTTAGWNGTGGFTAVPSGTITLKGEEADIDINGRSLMKTLDALEERLNMLTPNPEMEAEWDELRELGERYRELEKQCKEKTRMWNKLKSITKPNIDL